MKSTNGPNRGSGRRWAGALVMLVLGAETAALARGPSVEFDFARSVTYQIISSEELATRYPNEIVVRVTLPITVRFHVAAVESVEVIAIDIDGSSADLRVLDFSPSTQLQSDLVRPIETTVTSHRSRSVDATLGGELPVPLGEVVAHVTPAVSGGASDSEVATEKTARVPPKQAVVVSGTSHEGHGAFFKLKRSTQTSLEGVHVLEMTFLAPAEWHGDDLHVTCEAQGRRKVFWLDQPVVLGEEVAKVQIYLEGIVDQRTASESSAESVDPQSDGQGDCACQPSDNQSSDVAPQMDTIETLLRLTEPVRTINLRSTVAPE